MNIKTEEAADLIPISISDIPAGPTEMRVIVQLRCNCCGMRYDKKRPTMFVVPQSGGLLWWHRKASGGSGCL